MKCHYCLLGIVALLLTVLHAPFVWSMDAALAPEFSDPNYRVQMPESWVVKPIDRTVQTDVAKKTDLKVILDQQIFRLLQPSIQAFAKQNNLNIAQGDGTCGHSAGALAAKRTDIGGFCCPPRDLDRLPGLEFHTLGITPIALLVHPDNPIDNISIEEARKIFSGDISRWSQLKTAEGIKGPNRPVLPVGRLHCKPRPGHWRLILDNEDLFSPDLQEVGTIPDMISMVAHGKSAIGHAAYWFAAKHYRNKGKTKVLMVDGIHPSDVNAVAQGRYPFYKTFSVTTWHGPHVENKNAMRLVTHMLHAMAHLDHADGVVSASMLRANGWQFQADELIGSNR
ncbi:MAG: hypothetical protein HQL54_03670 [Magnetococcales bacterium]|nr:hypothetical protein [Magnetococcales bacterium]